MKLSNIQNKGVKIRVKYLSLLGYMAGVDGHLSEEELTLLEKLVARFQIPEKYHDQILPIKSFKEDEISEIFFELQEKKMEYSFFMDLISMAVADGIIQDSEQLMLAQILDLTDIKVEEFHNLIHFVQTATKLPPSPPIDPMYNSIISMVFQWAKKKKVKFYHQTTFALSDDVDSLLKSEYQYA